MAVVHDWTRSGNCRVFKFSAAKGVWKGPIRVFPGDVLVRLCGADRLPRFNHPLPAGYHKLTGYTRKPGR